ncbi:MAG: ubiquinol-cytochrome C chaperone family protein [Amphiplicatus sp.]
MILSLFRKDPQRDAAEALFAAAVEQARRPDFYTDLGVEDSVDGRFELLALHVYLVLRRLKSAGSAAGLSQHLLDAMFANLDGALREMGVGDLSVARKIRKMAEAFYGRIGAYEAALAPTAAAAALDAALLRNVYNGTTGKAAALSAYVRRASAGLDGQKAGRIEAGILAFPSPLSADAPREAP